MRASKIKPDLILRGMDWFGNRVIPRAKTGRKPAVFSRIMGVMERGQTGWPRERFLDKALVKLVHE
jgi:hypothetical protein